MTTSGRRANTSGTGKPPAARSRPAAGSDVPSNDAASQHGASQYGPGQYGASQHEAEPYTAAPSGRDSDFVQSLDRGLAVIRAFGPGRERLSLSDVSRETGLTRAAARRFLLTLVKLGYVRSDGREFSLRPLVLELGYAYLSGLAMPEIASPHLEELVARVRESSSISVLDGHQIVYVARVPTKRIMTVAISVGTRFPAYATSMGRVLLAGMSPDDLDKYLGEADFEPFTARTVTDPDRLREIVREVGRQGYAIVDQELEEGLRAIAAPIHGARNGVIAAVNLSAHASRVSLAAMRAVLLPALLETAGRIEADLRSQGVS
jgi:IclR family transcriptional regulator, pca regulon regulatory protein